MSNKWEIVLFILSISVLPVGALFLLAKAIPVKKETQNEPRP